MPHAYGAKAGEKTKVKELEKLGYTVIPENMIRCVECGGIYSVDQHKYWQSTSSIHKNNKALTKVKIDGKNARQLRSYIPYCKTCLLKDFDINNMSDVINLLYRIDIPYKSNKWNTIINNYNSGKTKTIEGAIGCYKKDIELNYKDERFSDGDNTDIEIKIDEEDIKDGSFLKKRERKEAIGRWGLKWSEFELMKLEEFYHNMMTANKIETPQDIDYLKKLARLSVKIDSALDDDEGTKAKQLGDLYSKYMSDSKFRAQDMTDADKQGGIRTFSQIYSEVESPDFIPPWEKYAKKLNIKQDIIDKVIMHIENFTLKFNSAEKMVEPPRDTPKIEEGD